MSQPKRLNLKCWNCDESFGLTVDIDMDNEPRFIRECYSCGARLMINLNPYRSGVTEALRDLDSPSRNLDVQLNLPSIIPTSKPEEE